MRWLHRRIGSLALPLVVATIAACGSDNNGVEGAIAITASKTSLTIPQGGSDNLTASITRSGGFTGDVAIVAEGAPTGVTATVSEVSTSGGTTTGKVTVNVAVSVALGSYTIRVVASGSGVTSVTQVVALTVTALPAISLTLNPTALTVLQGASGNSTVTIARTNFAENVTLALEGAPAGVTGTFTPTPTNGTTSTLAITVAASVAPGTITLTVRGTGAGVTAATAQLQLTVTTPTPSYSIALAPNPITVAQSASGNVVVTLTRTNLSATVNLTLEGQPTGVTGTFAPAAVNGTTSTLTLQVGPAVTPGNATLTVRGQTQGLTDVTATFGLTVTLTVQGNYALTTTPVGPVTVQQSAAAVNVTVNIGRTGGFAGSVALAVTGAPTGLTATLTPTSTTGNTSTLALTASTAAPTGNHQLTITGTAAGLANQTVNLTVAVTTAPAPGNVTLDYSACNLASKPTWVAFQNGTAGAWTAVTPTADVYSFNVTAAKAGLAIVTVPTAGTSDVSIQYFSQAEITVLTGVQRCPTSPTTKQVIATTSNIGLLQSSFVSLGGGTGVALASQPIATLNGVKNGTFDLVGYAHDIAGAGASDRAFIRRDVNTTPIADGGSVGATLDFTGSESAAAASATFTLGNSAGEQIVHGMSYQTGTSCELGLLYAGADAGMTTSFTAHGVPASMQRATDYHSVSLLALGGTTTSRLVFETFQSLSARTVTLPTLIPVITPTVLAGPYKRLQFVFTLPADLTTAASVGFTDNTAGRAVLIGATRAGFLGGSAVDLSMPDFSTVAGWNNAWAPASAASVDWNAAGSGTTLTSACSAGKFVSSARSGTI